MSPLEITRDGWRFLLHPPICLAHPPRRAKEVWRPTSARWTPQQKTPGTEVWTLPRKSPLARLPSGSHSRFGLCPEVCLQLRRNRDDLLDLESSRDLMGGMTEVATKTVETSAVGGMGKVSSDTVLEEATGAAPGACSPALSIPAKEDVAGTVR